MSQVIVIGAHGKIALLAQRLLSDGGHTVTGVIRNPEHVADVEASGAAAVVADVENLDTDALAGLVAGHDVVVWSAGAGGGNPSRTYAVDRDAAIRSVDASAQAGVPRFVMVSYFGAGPDHGVAPDHFFFPYADAKTAADAYVEQSPLAWTILRPSTLTLEPAGGIATSDTVEKQVSRATVAEVIAAVVDSPGTTAGRILRFNDGDEDVRAVVGG
ncbi:MULTISPECIES: SDR family oxidoreductase [unclassified Nocardioides]|uniref:SDR family oxidoreductase n=1 Tax=unclassified Nocardioides TaxID=2615069 RepID=UPI003014940A